MSTLRRFLPSSSKFAHAHRRRYAATVGLGLGLQAASALLMFFAGYLICKTATDGMILMAVMTPLACVQLFGIARPLARYFERLFAHDWVFRITSDLRRALFRFFALSYSRIAKTRSGDAVALLADDIGQFQNLYLRIVLPTLIALIMWAIVIVFFGVFSLAFAGMLALASALATIVCPLVSYRLFSGRIMQAKRATHDLYVQLADDVYGAAEWRRSLRTAERTNLSLDAEQKVRDEQLSLRQSQRALVLAAKLVLLACAIGIIVWSSATFAASPGQTSASLVAAFSLGWFPLFETFIPLVDAAFDAPALEESADRLAGCADDSLLLESAANDERAETPDGAEIAIRALSFTYPDTDAPVFANLDLTIAQGQKVAIIGRSGSGKSTLATLIRGELEPTSGTVEYGGIPASRLSGTMYRHVGIVEQDPYLFYRSLRDNVRIAKPDASDDDILAALSQAGLGELVAALPEGLDTNVGESGERFSGGERQRIALARVLLANPETVIFDEATTGLDPETERRILATTFEVFADKTLIVITHHLLGIELFDRVLFVEDGGIALDGSPSELAASSPRFQKLLAFDRGE